MKPSIYPSLYKIWLDDLRPAPDGYMWFKSVNDTKSFIESKKDRLCIFMLDLDHDLGDYAYDGGDAIRLIEWLLWNGYHEMNWIRFIFNFHTMNPVGRENMKALVDRYFKEV